MHSRHFNILQVRRRVELKHDMMRNHKEAQEKMKEELRRNVTKCKPEMDLEEAGQKKVYSESIADQRLDSTRKSSGVKDQHKLQAPVECDIPRTPTPDYADLNARFIILLNKTIFSFHSSINIPCQQILGLKPSWD